MINIFFQRLYPLEFSLSTTGYYCDSLPNSVFRLFLGFEHDVLSRQHHRGEAFLSGQKRHEKHTEKCYLAKRFAVTSSRALPTRSSLPRGRYISDVTSSNCRSCYARNLYTDNAFGRVGIFFLIRKHCGKNFSCLTNSPKNRFFRSL